MFKRHKHNWELTDKTVLAGDKTLENVHAWGYDYARIMQNALEARRDKVVHVFKCECGDVKVVKN